MQKEFRPQHSDAFTKGPQGQTNQQQAPMSEEDLAKLKKEQLDYMKKELPALKLKAEYQEYQMKMFESSVLLGTMDPKNVPGILGIELLLRDIEARTNLHRFKVMQEEARKEQEKKAESTGSIITDGQTK